MSNNSTNSSKKLQKKLENILREVENVNTRVNNNNNTNNNSNKQINKKNNKRNRINNSTTQNNRKNRTNNKNNKRSISRNNTNNNNATNNNTRNNTTTRNNTNNNNSVNNNRNNNTTNNNNTNNNNTNNNNNTSNNTSNNTTTTKNNNNNNTMTNNGSNNINLIKVNNTQEEVVNTNEDNNSQMNTSKNHFFIGYKLSNNFSNKLKKLQNDLLNYFNKKGKINGVKKVRTFHVRFVYLGYLEYSTALKFYNYLLPLLNAISQKFGPLECNIDRFAVKRSSTPKIILKFSNKYLELIKEYLRVNGTDKIFGGNANSRTSSKKSSDSHINILSFSKKDNDTNKIKEDLKNFNFNIKPPKFTIHAIDLLKGETIVRRKGQPSKSDEMFVERINDLKLDFIGSKN